MQPRSNLIKSLCEISNNIYIYISQIIKLFIRLFILSPINKDQTRTLIFSFNYPFKLLNDNDQIKPRIFLHLENFIKKTFPNQNYYKIQFDRGQKRENFAKHFQTHRVSAPRFNNILIPRDPVSPNATHTLPPPLPPSHHPFSVTR